MSGKMSSDCVWQEVPQRDNVTALHSFVSIIYHNEEAYNQLTCSAPSTPCPLLLLDIVWYYYFCLLNHPLQATSTISFSQCSNPSTAPTVLPKPFTKFLGKAPSISVYIMDDCWSILRNYVRSYQCPTDSCRIPVILAESGAFRRNGNWQGALPKVPFL